MSWRGVVWNCECDLGIYDPPIQKLDAPPLPPASAPTEGVRLTPGAAHAEGLSAFEAGAAFEALRAVSLGTRIAADGQIRASAKAALLALFRRSGLGDVRVAFAPEDDDRLIWRLSRYEWALKALEWLGAGGSSVLGSFHLHWIQGLLYGYGPDAIGAYLARPSGPSSSSRPCRPLANTAGSAKPVPPPEPVPAPTRERIMAAAIRQDGVVYTGPHHHQIIRYMTALGIKNRMDGQGFITSSNRWVDRYEGLRIAKAAEQPPTSEWPAYAEADAEMLFSEMLWSVPDYAPERPPVPPEPASTQQGQGETHQHKWQRDLHDDRRECRDCGRVEQRYGSAFGGKFVGVEDALASDDTGKSEPGHLREAGDEAATVMAIYNGARRLKHGEEGWDWYYVMVLEQQRDGFKEQYERVVCQAENRRVPIMVGRTLGMGRDGAKEVQSSHVIVDCDEELAFGSVDEKAGRRDDSLVRPCHICNDPTGHESPTITSARKLVEAIRAWQRDGSLPFSHIDSAASELETLLSQKDEEPPCPPQD